MEVTMMEVTMMNNSMYGNFRQNSFSDVFGDAAVFVNSFKASGALIMGNAMGLTLTDTQLTALYYMLYAEYGNSVVASSDTNRFKERLFNIIITYGPNLFKQFEIQGVLRNLTEDEITAAGGIVYNLAYNPNTEVAEDGILSYISQQQTNTKKTSKMKSYSDLLVYLSTFDFSKAFLVKFKGLFLSFVQPEEPLLYGGEE